MDTTNTVQTTTLDDSCMTLDFMGTSIIEQPNLRVIHQDELSMLLDQHEKWLKTIDARMPFTDVVTRGERLNLNNAIISHCTISHRDLSFAIFHKVRFDHCWIEHCTSKDTRFKHVILTETRFSNCIFNRSIFEDFDHVSAYDISHIMVKESRAIVKEHKKEIIDKVIEKVSEAMLRRKEIVSEMPKKSEVANISKEWEQYFLELIDKAIAKRFK